MIWLFLQAQDVWMFRTAKPFTAGEGFLAKSQFPPTPQTMQGVIRGAVIEASGLSFGEYLEGKTPASQDLIREIGNASHPGQLQVRGPFLAYSQFQKVEALYPLPKDIFGDEILRPGKRDFESNTPDEWRPYWRPLVSQRSEQGKKTDSGAAWLSELGFQNYLSGTLTYPPITEAELLEREVHVGIGMNYPKRTTEGSLFYHAEFIRPYDDVGLLVGLNESLGGYFGQTGLINMGGESRSAYYERVEYTPLGHQATSGNVKLILLSPAYFSDGWQPKGGDWSPWVGGGKWVSSAIDKPLGISGWDMAIKKPKPLYHYAPAGSVYFFEGAQLSGLPFTETPPGALNHAALGFGQYIATNW
jgi:CRISPR-associated protein Cmr3